MSWLWERDFLFLQQLRARRCQILQPEENQGRMELSSGADQLLDTSHAAVATGPHEGHELTRPDPVAL